MIGNPTFKAQTIKATSLKGIVGPMRKKGDRQWYHLIGLALSYSRCDFQTNRCKPHPVRDIKLLSEPCFYYLQPIIVSQRRMKNCWRYLNFADFFGTKGGEATVACGVLYRKFFLRLADV
jgi:hypothetical protein